MKETKFKQTEVGMIPSDWEVFELGQLYDITSSKRVFQKDWTSAGVPFYRAREIAVMSAGKTPEDDLFITREMFDTYTTQYGKIRENDVLITGVGTLGKVYVVKAKDEFYFKDGNIIWLQWKRKNSSLLLKLFFETNIVIDQIFGNSGGSTVATYTISNAKKTKIPLPPTIEEQQRIANALSDVDTLIANLEKLIAKKKNIKQGAMQQLLTGRKRLPGFGLDERTGSRPTDERRKECHSERSAKREVEESSGYKMTELGLIPSDWEVKTLNELCECNRSSTLSLPKEFVYVDLESVCQGKLLKRQIVKACDAPSRAQRFFEKGDILYQTVRPYQKNNLKVDFDAKNFIASTGYAVLHCKEFLLNSGYLYQYIHTDKFVDMVMDNCSGTSYPAINPKILMTFNIIVPSSIEEQTAIANVLSDMDTEISALETKLAKYRTLKTGMMQQLLTGKIRLV